ncbi:hypothetical protein NQ314_010952 [Rhamnusium bicolor]|uniref:C2H2-type domain-containing protein n=1 Tax=Rhamnusium bicolor TaxID=1586634 RepID=A0AAV8XME2_9CUCU|nr:hypothetical protein NQ314_010952 [Rhamnusium bicolor]
MKNFFRLFLDSKDIFPCAKCGKKFSVLGSLRRHIKYYCGTKPPPVTGYIEYDKDNYECQTCHRQYKTFNTMKRHLKYECGKPPSIECPILNCNYKAKIRDRMRQHVRMKHKIQI